MSSHKISSQWSLCSKIVWLCLHHLPLSIRQLFAVLTKLSKCVEIRNECVSNRCAVVFVFVCCVRACVLRLSTQMWTICHRLRIANAIERNEIRKSCPITAAMGLVSICDCLWVSISVQTVHMPHETCYSNDIGRDSANEKRKQQNVHTHASHHGRFRTRFTTHMYVAYASHEGKARRRKGKKTTNRKIRCAIASRRQRANFHRSLASTILPEKS